MATRKSTATESVYGEAATIPNMEGVEPKMGGVEQEVRAQLPDVIGKKSVTLSGREFKIKKQVTHRVLKQYDDTPFFVQFLSPAKRAPAIEAKYNPKKMEPPYIAEVVDLQTGEVMTLMMNVVLRSNLEREYPDNGYDGRSFAITRYNPTSEDKLYKIYDVVEIEYA